LPVVAAVGLAIIERTRLNEFVYWRSLEAQVAELLPIMRRSATVAEATRAAPLRRNPASWFSKNRSRGQGGLDQSHPI
jgi:hypothetical protein